jgi:hypothetical protein
MVVCTESAQPSFIYIYRMNFDFKSAVTFEAMGTS